MKEEEEHKQTSVPPSSETRIPERKSIVHSFDQKKSSSMDRKIIIGLFIAIFLGGLTGVIVASIGGSKSSGMSGGDAPKTAKEAAEKGAIIGAKEEGTFKDQAEGLLKEGGIDGEGAYHLEREGGESQNVYLTSSVIDLSEYIDRKVKVWGETNAAKTAGWLMDVGRLQILE